MWANFTGSELNYLNVSFIFNKRKESSLLRTHMLPIYKVSSFSATGEWTSLRQRLFLLALRRWGRFARMNIVRSSARNVPSGERGETDVFAFYEWTSILLTAAASFRNKEPTNSPILLKVANYFFLGFIVLYCCYSIKFKTSLNKNKIKLFQVKFNIPGAVKRKDA